MLPRANVVETNIGRFILFAAADGLSGTLYRRGTWEPLTLWLAPQLVKAFGRGNTVVDCGANVGAFTIPVAKELPQHRVVSFEVQRVVYYQLCGAVVLNRLDNVIAHNVGLAEAPGRLDLPLADYNADNNIGAVSLDEGVRALRGGTRWAAPSDQAGLPTESVEVVPLDHYQLTGVSLLKIDVEGMELKVLQGAARTLEASQFPPLLFELWPLEMLPEFADAQAELIGYIEGLGYKVQQVGDLGVAQHGSQAQSLLVAAEGKGMRVKMVTAEPVG